MTASAPARRHVSITVDGTTVDVAGGPHHSIAATVVACGIPYEPARFAIIDTRGERLNGSMTLGELADGARISVIDLTAGREPRRTRTASDARRGDHGVVWWLLAAVSAVLAGATLLTIAQATVDLPSPARIAVAFVAGLGSILAAALSVSRVALRHSPLAVTAAALLAFTAGTVAAPASARPAALGVTFGLVSVAVIMLAVLAVTRDVELHAIAGTVSSIALIFAGVWALTVFADWPTTTAAALCFGLVAPGVKFLPTTMLNVPEGYAISYRHFMTERWSVRGAVPFEPGPVTKASVDPLLAAARARMVAGTTTLSIAAVIFAPPVLGATQSPDALVGWGAWVAIGATLVVLMLLPRSATLAALRWVPRGAATLIAVEIVWMTASLLGPAGRTVAVLAVLFAALVAAALVVPIGKGTGSLHWSRFGDTVEAIAGVMALPASLLAAGTLELMRTAMAG